MDQEQRKARIEVLKRQRAASTFLLAYRIGEVTEDDPAFEVAAVQRMRAVLEEIYPILPETVQALEEALTLRRAAMIGREITDQIAGGIPMGDRAHRLGQEDLQKLEDFTARQLNSGGKSEEEIGVIYSKAEALGDGVFKAYEALIRRELEAIGGDG